MLAARCRYVRIYEFKPVVLDLVYLCRCRLPSKIGLNVTRCRLRWMDVFSSTEEAALSVWQCAWWDDDLLAGQVGWIGQRLRIDTQTATVRTFHSCDTFDFTILCLRSFDVGKRLKLETKVKSSSGGSCKSKFVGEQVILQTTSTYSCKCLVHWKGVTIYDNFMSADHSLRVLIVQSNYKCQWGIKFIHSDHNSYLTT